MGGRSNKPTKVYKKGLKQALFCKTTLLIASGTLLESSVGWAFLLVLFRQLGHSQLASMLYSEYLRSRVSEFLPGFFKLFWFYFEQAYGDVWSSKRVGIRFRLKTLSEVDIHAFIRHFRMIIGKRQHRALLPILRPMFRTFFNLGRSSRMSDLGSEGLRVWCSADFDSYVSIGGLQLVLSGRVTKQQRASYFLYRRGRPAKKSDGRAVGHVKSTRLLKYGVSGIRLHWS